MKQKYNESNYVLTIIFVQIFALVLWSAQSMAQNNTEDHHLEVLYRLNAGGVQVATHDDWEVNWTDDDYLKPSAYSNHGESGNKVWTTEDPVSMDASVPEDTPEKLFKSERGNDNYNVNALRWTFPVEEGQKVEVRLYFAEIFLNGPEMRLFNIDIENQRRLSNLDIYAEAGSHRGIMKSFLAESDGEINIDLYRVRQHPVVAAIEIIRLEDDFEFEIEEVTSASIALDDPEIRIFPNPFKENIYIQGNGQGSEYKVSIYNHIGVLMQSFSFTNLSQANQVNTSSLPAGIYFVKVESEDNKVLQTQKLIKSQ
ncbi:MAG: malectin domain-containing carbohydrate-binding protein [Cytophagaceae bacterium]